MRYVLFDLDGTLVDSSKGITRCFQYAFLKLELAPPSKEELRSCIGPPLIDSFLRFLNGDREKAERGVRFYRERYAVEGWKECELLPGAYECLKTLAAEGKILALATGKPQRFAENILSFFGLDAFFSVVVGSKEDNSFDEKGAIIQKAMALLGAEKERTVMVGDREHDIIGARKNGVPCVGLKIGFAAEGELESAGAAYLADDFSHLHSLLQASNG
ncbi:MAG: HAD hydrolase-like protein [Clostridia bacterium]|nr:HAD hydrolase-like protein [Clostridia bacterium]